DYLARVAEPLAPALSGFVERVGPVGAAERVRAGDVPTAVALETAARRHLPTSHSPAAGAEIRLVCPEDDEWPAALRTPTVFDRQHVTLPLALWVRGRVPLDAAANRCGRGDRRTCRLVLRRAAGHRVRV